MNGGARRRKKMVIERMQAIDSPAQTRCLVQFMTRMHFK